MLVQLFGENFRSFKGEFELSMVAADLKNEHDKHRGVIEVELAGTTEKLKLLRTVAIFGHNATGKSSILQSAAALNWLIRSSSSVGKPGGRISPYEPFQLDTMSRKQPVKLGCLVVFEKSLLRYEIKYDEKTIVYEKLVRINSGGEQILLERTENGGVVGELIERSDANKLYVQGMQPNVGVLSKLAQHGPSQGSDSVIPFYEVLSGATQFNDLVDASAGRHHIFPNNFSDKFFDDQEYQKWIMEKLILVADIGIAGVKIKKVKTDFPDQLRQEFEKTTGKKLPEHDYDVRFVHHGKTPGPIEFGEESAGTQKLFNMAPYWWRLANDDISLFADELGASIHPRLLDALIRAVNDPPITRMKSQLIFATHDTGLLEGHDGQPPALRRDQVYFTKKNENGISELYSLAEFKERQTGVHNLRKRYLSGLYGAIPMVERISL